jgi:hypothetical protein
VEWEVEIDPRRLDDIKGLMVASGIEYLWVYCVCINQVNQKEKAEEIAKMYQYYKSAEMCHILLDMRDKPKVWDPQRIVDDLKFLDHVLAHMKGAALASESMLTGNAIKRLKVWEEKEGGEWCFPLDKSLVRSAGIELGVLDYYSMSIDYVSFLFVNEYFTRVLTFQEMILGKNITMWGVGDKTIFKIGALDTWMDLATSSRDKAIKLQHWIDN